jgi:dynein heavy chain, axonemal
LRHSKWIQELTRCRDAELLEILSECKEPLKIQPFIRKIVEAVAELQWDNTGKVIGMVSVEGEVITFTTAVNPADTGAVELWLPEIEAAMKHSMHAIAGECLRAYAQTDRSCWILQWPGQLVLNCSQVYWTSEVAKAIEAGTLARYVADTTIVELNKIVKLVRGSLSRLERATCSTLVTIDVHARDVTEKLVSECIASPREFSWESQLRYAVHVCHNCVSRGRTILPGH